MKILVTGAYGFIGRGVVQALLHAGHEVIGAGRDLDLGRRLIPEIEWIFADFNYDLDPQTWVQRFQAQTDPIEGVVNCVGILQSDLRDKSDKVHGSGAIALFEGAQLAGVTKLVHISATTTDEAVSTDYAKSKQAGDQALAQTDLDWTIVRPCLVLGAGSNGGALLMRALAGLPFVIPVPSPGTQKFQPIALSDLSVGIVRLLEGKEQGESKDRIIYAVGPQVKSLTQILANYRKWLGFAPATSIFVPRFIMRALLLIGDLVSLFGNRTPMRTASLEQMDHFKENDPTPFQTVLGRPLKTMDENLAQRPAAFPDRQHARTAFLWPCLQWVLGLTWIIMGLEYFANNGLPAFNEGLTALFKPIGQGLTIVAGALLLSKRWLRWGGALKIGVVALASLSALPYVSSPSVFIMWVLESALLILIIGLVMGLNEKR